jgi:hypothetical protein
MILVVAGVIYVMPLVAKLVGEARSAHGVSCVTCSKVSVAHHDFTHHHADR